jgi:rare lipoprotein A
MTRKSNLFAITFVLFMCAVAPFAGYAQAPESCAGAISAPIKGTCFYYSDAFHGRTTASGAKYDKEAMTAAHNTLPFGTMVKVTNLKNNRSVVVRVTDRYPRGGPQSKIVEVTSRAAKELGMFKKGKTEVRIEVIETAKQ